MNRLVRQYCDVPSCDMRRLLTAIQCRLGNVIHLTTGIIMNHQGGRNCCHVCGAEGGHNRDHYSLHLHSGNVITYTYRGSRCLSSTIVRDKENCRLVFRLNNLPKGVALTICHRYCGNCNCGNCRYCCNGRNNNNGGGSGGAGGTSGHPPTNNGGGAIWGHA